MVLQLKLVKDDAGGRNFGIMIFISITTDQLIRSELDMAPQILRPFLPNIPKKESWKQG